jgi:CRISPR-associated protein Cas2
MSPADDADARPQVKVAAHGPRGFQASSDDRWHLLSYDIRDDRRRRRAHRHLLGWGERVQFSVFRIHASPRQLLRLRWELTRIFTDEDSLLVIPISDAMARQIQTLHQTTDWMEDIAPSWRAVGATGTTP